jgi:hypothetical protein
MCVCGGGALADSLTHVQCFPKSKDDWFPALLYSRLWLVSVIALWSGLGMFVHMAMIGLGLLVGICSCSNLGLAAC